MCTYTFDFPWNSHVESSVPYADSMFLSLKVILTDTYKVKKIYKARNIALVVKRLQCVCKALD